MHRGGRPEVMSSRVLVSVRDSSQLASSLLQSMAGPKQAVLAAALRLCVLLLSLSPCVVGGVLCAGTACLRLPNNSGGIGTVLGVPSGASNHISLVLTSL